MNWQKEALFTVGFFSKKSIKMDSFMPQKTVSMTFFTDPYTWNFSCTIFLI